MTHITTYVLLPAILFALILSGCVTASGDVPTGDVFIIFQSEYNGEVSDVEADYNVDRKLSRICRDLDALTKTCPIAGLEYGVDIPAYPAEWFDDKAVVVLAFYGSFTIDNDENPIPSVNLNYISVKEQTLEIHLHHTFENAMSREGDYMIIQAERAYGIVIEMDKKHLEGVNAVAAYTPLS